MQTHNPAQHKAIRVESGQLKKRPRNRGVDAPAGAWPTNEESTDA